MKRHDKDIILELYVSHSLKTGKGKNLLIFPQNSLHYLCWKMSKFRKQQDKKRLVHSIIKNDHG